MTFYQKVKEYYPEYLQQHTKKWTRRFHFFGQLFTLSYLLFCIYNHYWLLLLLLPIVNYSFPWFSHFVIEKNKPATFRVDALLTKCCDIVMAYEMLTGKIKF